MLSFLSNVGNRWYEIRSLFECCGFGCHCVGLKYILVHIEHFHVVATLSSVHVSTVQPLSSCFFIYYFSPLYLSFFFYLLLLSIVHPNMLSPNKSGISSTQKYRTYLKGFCQCMAGIFFSCPFIPFLFKVQVSPF